MRSIRSRLIMVGIVAGIATLSVGATAYAAGQEQRLTTTSVEAETALAAAPTPSATPLTDPAPAAPTPAVPTPTAAAPIAAEPAESTGADAADEVVVADETTPADGTSGDGTSGDGNVVEVRTPNPDAIPDTPEEYEHFYGLITECMAQAGFDWHGVRHTIDGQFAGVDMTSAGDVEPGLQAAFTLALYGDTGGGDYYHWADAGCWGYAVHVTGNDGNN